MGILTIAKALFSFRREIRAEHKRNTMYLNMEPQELLGLEDAQLYAAVKVRMEKRLNYENLQADFDVMTFAQKVFFALDYYEMEVNNGGLCQFFVNSSRMVAPYISAYLEVIGETQHRALYDGFIEAHNIDVTNLGSFAINTIAEYDIQTKRYPFDEFDSKFYDQPSLEGSLVTFLRANIDVF